jgi:hypothetical protein
MAVRSVLRIGSALLPRNLLLLLLLLLRKPQGLVREGLSKLRKSIRFIGSRTRDLLVVAKCLNHNATACPKQASNFEFLSHSMWRLFTICSVNNSCMHLINLYRFHFITCFGHYGHHLVNHFTLALHFFCYYSLALANIYNFCYFQGEGVICCKVKTAQIYSIYTGTVSTEHTYN